MTHSSVTRLGKYTGAYGHPLDTLSDDSLTTQSRRSLRGRV